MVTEVLVAIRIDIPARTVHAHCTRCGERWSEQFERIAQDPAGNATPEEQALLAELMNGGHVCPTT